MTSGLFHGASKAFVLSFSEAVRQEVRGAGESSTALYPGPSHTGFIAAMDNPARTGSAMSS